jgi:phospholipid-binding lipoprotein MlaA
MNRDIFAFNETLDKYALEPVAKGWDFVVPGFAQTGVENFFDNLGMPMVFANNLLQANPKAAGWDLLRLIYNSSFGLGGFIDIATMVGMPENDEDFGQTLGVWGVPSGPFLMVPLLGPYTIRSGAGDIVDTVGQPQGWFIPIYASIGMKALELLNLRAIYLEEIAESRADAFDYYVFIRNAYLQNRRAKVANQTDEAIVDDDDLYYFDDEEDWDDEDLDADYDEEEDEDYDVGSDEDEDASGGKKGEHDDVVNEEESNGLD